MGTREARGGSLASVVGTKGELTGRTRIKERGDVEKGRRDYLVQGISSRQESVGDAQRAATPKVGKDEWENHRDA